LKVKFFIVAGVVLAIAVPSGLSIALTDVQNSLPTKEVSQSGRCQRVVDNVGKKLENGCYLARTGLRTVTRTVEK
jgi:hypothetical protein